LQQNEADEFHHPACLFLWPGLRYVKAKSEPEVAPLPRTSPHRFIQKGFCSKDSLWCVGYFSGLLLELSCSKRSWMSSSGLWLLQKPGF